MIGNYILRFFPWGQFYNCLVKFIRAKNAAHLPVVQHFSLINSAEQEHTVHRTGLARSKLAKRAYTTQTRNIYRRIKSLV